MPLQGIPAHDFKSEITLYEKVPYDSNHTICYYPAAPTKPSYQDVDSVLYKYRISTYTALSFVRKSDRKVRVQGSYNNTVGANYIRIYNGTAWGDHPYYGFVTDVIYVNETTIEIYFVIDTIMTYISSGYLGLNQCWIDRETVYDDTVGANLMPENVDMGDYIFNDCKDLTPDLQHYCILMAIFVPGEVKTDTGSTTTDPTTEGGTTVVDTSSVTGSLFEGMYSAATIRAFPTTSGAIDHINRQLSEYAKDNKADNVYLYMAPKSVTGLSDDTKIDENGIIITDVFSLNSHFETITLDENRGKDLNGYKPRNNKLFTYPYNFLSISNNSGGSLNLRYEYFDDKPTFQLDICALAPVSAVLRPKNYEGVGRTRDPNKSLAISGYPMCPWMTDGYTRWVAGNRGTIASGIISGVATLLGGGMAAQSAELGVQRAVDMGKYAVGEAQQTAAGYETAGAILNQYHTQAQTKMDLGQSAAGLIGKLYDGYRQPNYVNGTTTPGSIQFSSGLMSFFGGRMSIKAEYAKSIDDYFTMYGYKVNRYGFAPTLQNRGSFDYVKTNVCNLLYKVQNVGTGATAAEVSEIEGLFNRGLRFSHEADGSLSLNNPPVNPDTGEQV